MSKTAMRATVVLLVALLAAGCVVSFDDEGGANTVSITVGEPAHPYRGPWPHPVCPDEQALTVALYFGNEELNPGLMDPGLVFPVERTIPADADLAETVVELLFAGPTDEEVAEEK